MKLLQKMMLAVFLSVLMLGTICHAEQPSLLQDMSIGQAGVTQLDCSGEWYVIYAEYQGVPYDPSHIGENMVLHINQDGTAEGITQGYTETYTWSIEDGCLRLYQGSSLIETCYAIDGNLVSIDGNAVIVFGRNVVAETNTPAVLSATSMDAFNGTWLDAFIIKGGVWIPQSISHMYSGIVIDNGAMQLFNSFDQSKLFQEAPTSYQMTFSDGKLASNDTNVDNYFALHEGDILSMHTNGDVIYFHRAKSTASDSVEERAQEPSQYDNADDQKAWIDASKHALGCSGDHSTLLMTLPVASFQRGEYDDPIDWLDHFTVDVVRGICGGFWASDVEKVVVLPSCYYLNGELKQFNTIRPLEGGYAGIFDFTYASYSADWREPSVPLLAPLEMIVIPETICQVFFTRHKKAARSGTLLAAHGNLFMS